MLHHMSKVPKLISSSLPHQVNPRTDPAALLIFPEEPVNPSFFPNALSRDTLAWSLHPKVDHDKSSWETCVLIVNYVGGARMAADKPAPQGGRGALQITRAAAWASSARATVAPMACRSHILGALGGKIGVKGAENLFIRKQRSSRVVKFVSLFLFLGRN